MFVLCYHCPCNFPALHSISCIAHIHSIAGKWPKECQQHTAILTHPNSLLLCVSISNSIQRRLLTKQLIISQRLFSLFVLRTLEQCKPSKLNHILQHQYDDSKENLGWLNECRQCFLSRRECHFWCCNNTCRAFSPSTSDLISETCCYFGHSRGTPPVSKAPITVWEK